MDKKKVILDTDIGSFIDDSLCLAYLLLNPQCDLLGITTVSGDTDQRARYAHFFCESMQRDIPIFAGIPTPLILEPSQSVTEEMKILQKLPSKGTRQKEQAVDFLRDTIYANPREVVLLGTGPLTNIAVLFALDREIPQLLKSLVLMCGSFSHGRNNPSVLEWNAKFDPHATAIVYRRFVPIHRSIGLDITTQVVLKPRNVIDKFRNSSAMPMLKYFGTWVQEEREIIFHDPLAATTIFDDGICTFEKGHVEVELSKSDSTGMTYWLPQHDDGNHEIANRVNRERFFEQYFSVFS